MVTLANYALIKLTSIMLDLIDTKCINKVIPTPMLQV